MDMEESAFDKQMFHGPLRDCGTQRGIFFFLNL